LRRQDIEALRARDARRGLKGKGGKARRGQGLQPFVVEGVQHADQNRAGFHACQFGSVGRPHLEHQFGAQRLLGGTQGRTGRHVGLVGIMRGGAGPLFDNDLMFGTTIFLDGVGSGGDTSLSLKAFPRDTYLHVLVSIILCCSVMWF